MSTNLTVVAVGQDREFAQKETSAQLAQPDFSRPCRFADRQDRRGR
jgi:hypothetical protein